MAAEARTEEPTPRRLAEARAEGRVAQSGLVTWSAGLAAGGLVLVALGVELAAVMRGMVARGLALAVVPGMQPHVTDAYATGWRALAPILGAVVAGTVLAGMTQTGFLFAPRALRRPLLVGLPRGVVGEALFRVAAALVVLAALIAVAAPLVAELPRAAGLGASELILAAGRLCGRAGGLALGALAALAAADWLRRRHRLLNELRMTRREIDDERREAEGDPRRRQAQRRHHRELLVRPLAGATLVVTDGDRVVVVAGTRVAARAAGFAARRLVEGARAAGVNMLHDPPLLAALEGGDTSALVG